MGSEVINPTKPVRYNLSMSRRTRKPWSSLINDTHHQDITTENTQPKPAKEQDKNQEIDHKSLNNLMRCEEDSNGGANVDNKSSLGQHFGDDERIKKKTMQMVVKKEKQGGENGVKFKGMMGRYVKVLSGLMKAKRDRKTSVTPFKT